MAAQTTHFFQGKAKAGRPLDHGPAPSAAVSSPLSPPKRGFQPDHSAIQYCRGTSRTGRTGWRGGS